MVIARVKRNQINSKVNLKRVAWFERKDLGIISIPKVIRVKFFIPKVIRLGII